jgi:hypothetical protein
MADVAAPNTASPSAVAVSGSKKATSPKKKTTKKPSHPPTSEMVYNAIKNLKERGGSSLQAIKKYVAANYKVDAERVSPFIKKYLKSAVADGKLVQTKGKGASGSFKLATNVTGKQAASDAAKPKTTTAAKRGAPAKSAKSPKKATTAAAKGKKAASLEKKAGPGRGRKSGSAAVEKKTAGAPKVAKSPAKTTKKGGPTKKPKAPKPKRAKAAPKTVAAKKPAPKKK